MPSASSPPATAAARPPAVDDAQLVARSLEAPHAFAELFRRHERVVYRYVASRLGPDTADDVVADTFLAAFRQRRRFDPQIATDARPWLLGIATRLIARHRADERRWIERAALTGRHVAPESAGQLDAGAGRNEDGVADRMDAAAEQPALAASIARISARQRDPLLLHVLGGLSYEEVADALHLPVGTVRSRIHRARSALAADLGRRGGEGAP